MLNFCMQGKVVRRIALRSGCGNDLTENHVAISEIAPGMYRVYLIAGTSDKSTQGTEKSAGIVSKAKAVKLAEDLRDDRLRRGFRLTNDWQWPQSRYIWVTARIRAEMGNRLNG